MNDLFSACPALVLGDFMACRAALSEIQGGDAEGVPFQLQEVNEHIEDVIGYQAHAQERYQEARHLEASLRIVDIH